MGAMLLLYFLSVGVARLTGNLQIRFVVSILLMFTFLLLVAWAEKKELQSMPFIGKYIRKFMA